MWRKSGMAVDLLASTFLLPFLTCLIVSRLVGFKAARAALLAALATPLVSWWKLANASREPS